MTDAIQINLSRLHAYFEFISTGQRINERMKMIRDSTLDTKTMFEREQFIFVNSLYYWIDDENTDNQSPD